MSVTDESYAALLARVIDADVRTCVEKAEETGRFPRELLERFGRDGVFTRKWGDSTTPDLGAVVDLGLALGRLGSAGVGVGVSLHDSAIAILRRFGGRSETLRSVADQAIAGEAVLCLAASESSGGSDLQIVETEIRPEGDGFRVVGRKKFVSLSSIADHVLVVARSHDGPTTGHGNVALVLVPTAQVAIAEPYVKAGAGPLDTAAITIDTVAPADALVARPGTGLAVVSWGLAHERLSIAAQVTAACELVLGVTVARMQDRTQFGRRLFDHQALRLRVADLHARVTMLRHALAGIVAVGKLDLRTASAAKVTAARLGEEVMAECMHIFGGSAYLLDETPLARWWRDMKLARVGGGTDEVLWELVAAGMRPDTDRYREFAASIA